MDKALGVPFKRGHDARRAHNRLEALDNAMEEINAMEVNDLLRISDPAINFVSLRSRMTNAGIGKRSHRMFRGDDCVYVIRVK